MTGIGGDAFCLFYHAATRKVHALNGSGRSPAKASLDDVCRDLNVTDRSSASIPNTSIHSVTVPGAAAAWLDIIDKYGSGEVAASQVLAPAIRMAEEGVPVSEISSYNVNNAHLYLSKSELTRLFSGKGPRRSCKERLSRKDYSSTIRPTMRSIGLPGQEKPSRTSRWRKPSSCLLSAARVAFTKALWLKQSWKSARSTAGT